MNGAGIEALEQALDRLIVCEPLAETPVAAPLNLVFDRLHTLSGMQAELMRYTGHLCQGRLDAPCQPAATIWPPG